MPNSFYSPNQKISGGASFFSFNSKDGCVYIKLLKQIANNPDKKGNFDGANPINIKLGQDEVADIIRAVRTNGESKFYHQFKDTVTSGSFKFYTIPNTTPPKSGFGLSVKKKTPEGQETEIKCGFTLASAERLSLYLQNALTHIFDAEYSQDIKEAKEYQEKKLSAPKSEQTKQLESKTQIVSEEEIEF